MVPRALEPKKDFGDFVNMCATGIVKNTINLISTIIPLNIGWYNGGNS